MVNKKNPKKWPMFAYLKVNFMSSFDMISWWGFLCCFEITFTAFEWLILNVWLSFQDSVERLSSWYKGLHPASVCVLKYQAGTIYIYQLLKLIEGLHPASMCVLKYWAGTIAIYQLIKLIEVLLPVFVAIKKGAAWLHVSNKHTLWVNPEWPFQLPI